jgi:hypothetical protein
MRSMALLLLLPAAAAFAQKPAPYESPDGSFRVAFPKEPTVQSRKLATPAGQVPVTTTRIEAHKELVLSVTVTTYPDSFADVTPAKLFDAVRDGMKSADGTVKSEKEISFGAAKHPGRDVVIDAGKTTIHARLILVDHRLYQVMLTGSKDRVAASEGEFLKSFELLK